MARGCLEASTMAATVSRRAVTAPSVMMTRRKRESLPPAFTYSKALWMVGAKDVGPLSSSVGITAAYVASTSSMPSHDPPSALKLKTYISVVLRSPNPSSGMRPSSSSDPSTRTHRDMMN